MLTTRPEEQKKTIVLLVAIVAVIALTGFMFVSQGRARSAKKAPPKIVSSQPAQTTGSTSANPGAGEELKTRVSDLFSKDLEFNAIFEGLDPFRPSVNEHPDLVAAKGGNPVADSEAPANPTRATTRPTSMVGTIGAGAGTEPVRPNVPPNVGIQAKNPVILVMGVITGGTAMAILRVDSSDRYFAVGESVGSGVRVEAITDTGVRLRVNGESRMIPVGGGVG